jgi:hypothetical protein
VRANLHTPNVRLSAADSHGMSYCVSCHCKAIYVYILAGPNMHSSMPALAAYATSCVCPHNTSGVGAVSSLPASCQLSVLTCPSRWLAPDLLGLQRCPQVERVVHMSV